MSVVKIGYAWAYNIIFLKRLFCKFKHNLLKIALSLRALTNSYKPSSKVKTLLAKYKSLLNWLIKLSIVILASIFIWKRLNTNKDLGNFPQILHNLNTTHFVWAIVGLALLMLLNWVSEAYKWQMQLRDIDAISIWASIQAIFCGITVGIITPNRVGEYGTRVFFLRPRVRVYGLIAIGVGGLAQFLLINVIAAVALTTFLYQYKHVDANFIVVIAFGFAVYCTLLSLLYFNMELIRRLIGKVKFLTRYQHFLEVLSTYKSVFLNKLLAIGLFRTAILVVQYYIAIHLFIPSITFTQVALMTSLIISVQTVLPTIEILDIGVRGATSVYFFGFITHHDVPILAATSLIWLINLILPAIIGLAFVYKLKLFGQS